VTAIAPPGDSGDLVIHDLTVEYSSGGYAVRPIDHLNLTMGSGELAILLGASGCGKSTLLSALAAILTPTSGSIRLGDQQVVGLRGAKLTAYRRNTVGVIFQAFNLVPSLTAVENVMLPLRAAGISRKAARVRATALLDELDLTERLQHKPGDMSGGQQQRVAIARALAHDPPLLLADEPTAHLDYIQVDSVLRLLRTLARPGRIVVVATHDDRLVPLADRVVELSPHAAGADVPPEVVTLSADQVLFEQGEPGERVYIVDSGQIDLIRRRVDGGEELIATAGPGDYFGELAPLFGLRRSAAARAKGETVVTGLSLRDFRSRMSPGSLSEMLSRAADH
jgi:putative ABC transport system ATP-binding protein